CLRELSQVSNVRIRFCCSASASPVEETSGSGLPTHHQMVLMEVELPNVSGVECVQRLRELFPDMQVVMHTVSVHDNTPADTSAPYDGSGPLAFSVAVPEDESLAGGDPSAFNAYPGKESGSMNANDRSSLESAPLSKREEDILRYVAKGLINKEIADVLDISLETVRSHLKNIYEKLHVRSRTEAVVKHWHD
ncbi:MAG: response regulator transcription factor, partial [Candidatus Omnitrophica bacterium]|nr:response regulator transcription factor [Candidatus Omnitrophota bacterium]